jgi:hypothetical protein
VGEMFCVAFDKTVKVAARVCGSVMEIQSWEGAARRCVEAVLRSATATGMRVNEGVQEKV